MRSSSTRFWFVYVSLIGIVLLLPLFVPSTTPNHTGKHVQDLHHMQQSVYQQALHSHPSNTEPYDSEQEERTNALAGGATALFFVEHSAGLEGTNEQRSLQAQLALRSLQQMLDSLREQPHLPPVPLSQEQHAAVLKAIDSLRQMSDAGALEMQ